MSLIAIVFLLAIFHSSLIHALPSFLEPTKGSTPEGELQCYSLPYGGLGSVSHLITFYMLVCLWFRRRPAMPWWRLEHVFWTFFVGILTFIISIAFAAFTVIRCRNSWQFMLIAVWKIFLSAALGISTVTASLSVKAESPPKPSDHQLDRAALMAQSNNYGYEMRNRTSQNQWRPQYADEARRVRQFDNDRESNARPEESSVNFLWVVLYLPGLVTGLIGLFSLVRIYWDNHNVRVITYYMWGIPVGFFAFMWCTFLGVRICSSKNNKSFREMIGNSSAVMVAILGVTSAFYSDLILGAIAGNFGGIPSGDVVWLFWGYFIAKKLPLGSL